MDLTLLNTPAVLAFLLVTLRITGMIVAAPFFSQLGVPKQLQAMTALMLAMLLFPVYAPQGGVLIDSLPRFFWLASQEMVIGMLIGFMASMVFAAVEMAGNHVNVAGGLNAASMLDPVTQNQAPITSQVYFILAITLFMTLNMHHGLILAVGKSFAYLPPAGAMLPLGALAERFVQYAGDIFTLSVILILPVMGTILVLEIALAFVAKIMPQMNVFMVTLPAKVGITLVLMMATLPYTMERLVQEYETLTRHLMSLYHP